MGFYMVDIKCGGYQTLSQLLIGKNYALPNLGGGSPKLVTVVNSNGVASKSASSSSSSVKGASKNLVRVMNGQVTPSASKHSYPQGELKLDVGDTYEVLVTNVETINDFYIQLSGKSSFCFFFFFVTFIF